MHGKQVETEPGNRRLAPYLAGIEPVFQLAAIEHQLQRADPEAQDEEADEIERLTTHIAGIADECEDPENRQKADRQVDIEHPAPTVIFGQPAPECRPHDRPEDGSTAEYCHRMAVPLGRVDLQQ